MISGCAMKEKGEGGIPPLPPKPVLENSHIDNNGTLHIPKGDKEELMLYIKQLENLCTNS